MESENRQEKLSLIRVFTFPFLFVFVMWAIKAAEWHFDFSLGTWGIYPRTREGLKGIFLMHFIHGDFRHLINNTFPMLLLGAGIFYFYRAVSYRIYFWTLFMTGLWVWVAARSSYHIGASGMIYGFASFIFFSGIFRAYPKLLALSLLVVFLYGGMVWGVFPGKEGISWEGHLFGAIAGLFLAFHFREEGPEREKYSWEEEEEEEDNTGNHGTGADPGIHYVYKPENSGEKN